MMTRIPIVTQNFSSPDVFSDTPLMLLPQASSIPPVPDRDNEGFSQLLLHDLHRHRQSYVRSFTAFETLKKRQDFVLRQENLRSLQTFEQRVTVKQDQYLDQSFHSYEQCFVKVINGNSNTNGHHHDQPKSLKVVAPSFDRYHVHQLSHTPATPLDPPAIIPFHRYQKSHRPPVPSKYRSHPTIQRSAQCFHDAFQSSSFLHQSQPFLSFTEGYLQKYGDRPSSRFPMATGNDALDGISEKKEEEDQTGHEEDQKRIKSAGANHSVTHSRSQEPRVKSSDIQRIRATLSSRNTNTPSSTPQITYNDAVRDGLTIGRGKIPVQASSVDLLCFFSLDDEDYRQKMSSAGGARRLSQQSADQSSNGHARTGAKRPKSGKKKQQIVVDLNTDKRPEVTTALSTENDLWKKAITVQNYGNNFTGDQPASSIFDRLPASTTTRTLPVKKTSSPIRRSSIRSNDGNSGMKQLLDNVNTQMTATITTTTTPLTHTDPTKAPVAHDTSTVPVLAPVANNNGITGDKLAKSETSTSLQTAAEALDPRKRLRAGPFNSNGSMKDTITFELDFSGRKRDAMKRTRFQLAGKINGKTFNEDGTEQVKENQATLDLLEKIRLSATGTTLGQLAVSQHVRLPFTSFSLNLSCFALLRRTVVLSCRSIWNY